MKTILIYFDINSCGLKISENLIISLMSVFVDIHLSFPGWSYIFVSL